MRYPVLLYISYLRFSLFVYPPHSLRCFFAISCEHPVMFAILGKIMKRLVDFLDLILKILQLILTYSDKTSFR